MEALLKDIIKGVSRTYGVEFFSAIALQLDKVIKSDYTFIARLDHARHVANTIAFVAHGNIVDNLEYALKDTPCDNVADNQVCIYPEKAYRQFPKDQWLVDMNIEGYLGAPLHDSQGKVVGIIVALYEKCIPDQSLTLTLFQLFSGRIVGEFERLDRENQLIELNNNLDIKVRERTKALELTVEKLEKAQSQLVESEKMAALGELVSGVAHEVNTPLGVAITAESHLTESFLTFKQKLDAQHLTIKDMKCFTEQHELSLPMIARNLQRAKEIIDNFKALATDQSLMEPECISLGQYYQRVILTLTPLLKRKKATISFSECPNDFITTFPGCHAQLLTNLVSNSIEHAFTDNSDNCIFIIMSHDEKEGFTVDYHDNGKGIPQDIQDKIFEPFFTSSRNEGNTGLGLSIAYNQVVQNLSGSIECVPSEQGAHFRYSFKAHPAVN